MTYTFPLVHKYRFIIAILLTAFVSASMIAFKIASPASAQAVSDTDPHVSNYIVPVLYSPSHATSSLVDGANSITPMNDGVITATGKLTFERPRVTTTPAPKKEDPPVKKTEDAKPDSTPADADAAAPNSPAVPNSPAAPAAPTKAQAPARTAAPAPVPANNSAAAPVGAAPMVGTSPAASQAFARSYLAGKGMGEAEFQCLVTLWHKESGWNFQASNPSSGAYGIPQSLPGNKMASAGADWQTNPQTQIIWGVGYITGRYGTPCGAVAAWNVKGWY